MVIIIEDMNDNAPIFTESRYEFSMQENQPGGMTLGHVGASDRDTGVNAKITYRLEPVVAGSRGTWSGMGHESLAWNAARLVNRFYVDENGTISTREKLDREQDGDVLEMLVVASDGGSPQLTGTATILVHIEDVNDNAVEWVYPLLNGVKIQVPANVGPNALIAQFQATDRDAGENGRVSYKFNTDQNTIDYSKIFTLNESTGQLTLKSLANVNSDAYMVHIVAKDGGKSPTQSTRYVAIDFLGYPFTHGGSGRDQNSGADRGNPFGAQWVSEDSLGDAEGGRRSLLSTHANTIIIISLFLIFVSLVCFALVLVIWYKYKLSAGARGGQSVAKGWGGQAVAKGWGGRSVCKGWGARGAAEGNMRKAQCAENDGVTGFRDPLSPGRFHNETDSALFEQLMLSAQTGE